MLKIKLTPPVLINRKYVVFVDSDVKKVFPSRRQACDFITKVEGELNEALLFINEQYCDLTTFYRTYFIADSDFKFKYSVENDFTLVNNRLNYISSHTSSENLNPIVSQAINICFDTLCEICDEIETKSRNRYDMLTRRRIVLHKKIINQYRSSFESFKSESIFNDTLRIKTA